jgi:two-component system, sensor histidine kinase ChiS
MISDNQEGSMFRAPIESDPNKTKIIIIDDDEFFSEIIAAGIQLTSNYLVTKCQTAMEGLDRITEIKPQLVILDLTLPDMTGLDLIRTIKENNDTRDIPIIVVSGSDEMQSRRDSLKAGAAMFLTKPLQAGELRKKIEELVA